jgi:hypothetical protein
LVHSWRNVDGSDPNEHTLNVNASSFYAPKGKRIAFVIVLVASVAASAQTVSFRNSELYTTPADRRVYDVQGRPLVGANYLAQLYYGPYGTGPASLTPHTALARFRNIPTTDSFAGTWVGGVRTLSGMGPGQMVTLQVRVWDERFGSTFEQAVVNPASSNQYGVSCPFWYTICTPGHCPMTIENFRSFSLVTNPPPGVIQIRRNGGCFQEVFLGRHNVDASADLLSWTPLGTQTSPFVSGVFTNFVFTNHGARFYRLRDETNAPASQLR